jgi:anaerobic ribonucleoside-triphosphate reductase activating protein
VSCTTSHNPAAGQWDGRRLSARMIADYKPFIATDGQGIRCSVYVAGCPFHCAECWNESIWNFRAGHSYTVQLEDQILTDLAEPYVQGITFLGGEPLLNTPVLLPLARRIRAEFGAAKDIWCWTGYTWEELQRPGETPDKAELLDLVDILVDGRFIAAQKDSLLQFRGSANQRILDVPASRRAGHPMIWAGLHDLTRRIPELYGKQRAAAEGTG